MRGNEGGVETLDGPDGKRLSWEGIEFVRRDNGRPDYL